MFPVAVRLVPEVLESIKVPVPCQQLIMARCEPHERWSTYDRLAKNVCSNTVGED